MTTDERYVSPWEVSTQADPSVDLAVAVIRLALHDRHRAGPHGESARRFLGGSPAFSFWCHVAGVNAEHLLDALHERVVA